MGSVARKEGVPRPTSPRQWMPFWFWVLQQTLLVGNACGAAGALPENGLRSVSTLQTEPVPSLTNNSAPRDSARWGSFRRGWRHSPAHVCRGPSRPGFLKQSWGNRCFRTMHTHLNQQGRADSRTQVFKFKFLKTRFSLNIYIEKGHQTEDQLSIPSPQALMLGCY